jgi:hypothetical protein
MVCIENQTISLQNHSGLRSWKASHQASSSIEGQRLVNRFRSKLPLLLLLLSLHRFCAFKCLHVRLLLSFPLMRLHLLCEFVFSQLVTFNSFTASSDLISPRLCSCFHPCSPSQIWTICISCSSSICVSCVYLWGFPLSNSAMSVLHQLVWSAACYDGIPALNWSRCSAEKKDQLWVTPLVHVCKWKTLPTKYSLILNMPFSLRASIDQWGNRPRKSASHLVCGGSLRSQPEVNSVVCTLVLSTQWRQLLKDITACTDSNWISKSEFAGLNTVFRTS